jgi:hypothetical protein
MPFVHHKIFISVPTLVLMCACSSNSTTNSSNSTTNSCINNYSCDEHQVCVLDACEDIFDRNFEITIVSGEASTAYDWDTLGGAPDPFVSFSMDDDYCETDTQLDTFYPIWNASCTMVVGSGGTFSVEMYDEDLSDHDLMATYSASGNDELAALIREEYVTLSSSISELNIRFEPDF